jgi:hypothetical protein
MIERQRMHIELKEKILLNIKKYKLKLNLTGTGLRWGLAILKMRAVLSGN